MKHFTVKRIIFIPYPLHYIGIVHTSERYHQRAVHIPCGHSCTLFFHLDDGKLQRKLFASDLSALIFIAQLYYCVSETTAA